MSKVPLPSTSTLKALPTIAPQPLRPYVISAVEWLTKNLDIEDIEEEDSNIKEDEIEKQHEEEERLRELEQRKKLLEQSKVAVPVLLHKMSSPSPPPAPTAPFYVQNATPRKPSKTRHTAPPSHTPSPAPTQEPVPTPQRTSTPQPEIMQVPTPPSAMASPFELAGSEFIIPTKIRISPRSQERVTRELKEAMDCDFFKMWPTFEDPLPGQGKVDGSGVFVKAAGMEESGVYVKPMSAEEKERREAIAREWMARKERSTEGRRRVKGGKWGEGYESVVERDMLEGMSEWGFRPTLENVVEERSREVKGEKGREIRMSTIDKEIRAEKGYQQQKASTSEKEKKNKESKGASTGDPATRAIRKWAERDHRQHRASKLGKGETTEVTNSANEDLQSDSQSQSKHNQGVVSGSTKIQKPRTTYRPWAKDHENKDGCEEDLPFDPEPRKDKRARFSSNDSLN
jgi:hypothetical protein